MRKRKIGCVSQVILTSFILIMGIVLAVRFFDKDELKTVSDLKNTTRSTFDSFLAEHGLTSEDYPAELIDLLANNPETEEFVLNYPLLKDQEFPIDLSQCRDSDSVPLLMQWDKRWGYQEYGDTVIGLSGCGPTCLSMVAIHLLDDTGKDPAWMADFSTKNGFCVPGNGTAWELMSTGAEMLGLEATELPLDENRIIRNLKAGNPIICIMGPGDFTSSGHYIVLTGYQDGKITVNDPNSMENSAKLWEYEKIQDQIRNLWTYTA